MVAGFEELQQDQELPLLIQQPDPLIFELNHLQNLLREKDKDLGLAQGEIKALKASEALKSKAVEELENELNKMDEKLSFTENLLQHKNLEIKKLTDEKKNALAAQFAAEGALRRVYADQKDDDHVPVESILAPLEAEIRICKNEIASLTEDKKALERLTKSKETALIETENILRSALERALIVEEIQNQNMELRRQIEICQEENKILEKTNRQKVVEVEKLSQTIRELEEAVLKGGANANVIRDCQRQISQLNEEKRTLERELARAKVSANRVATVVANEWKDENDKVMPVRQWLEERKLLQAEMNRLKEKLAITERTAKAEAMLKDKLKLRLKALEEGLKQTSAIAPNPYAFPRLSKSNQILGFLSNGAGLRKRSTSQPRASSLVFKTSPLHPALEKIGNDAACGEAKRRSLWVSRSKVVDNNRKENTERMAYTDANLEVPAGYERNKKKDGNNAEIMRETSSEFDGEDLVSGFLYDRLQKEVISLRKLCEAKDCTLDVKNEEIKALMKRVDTLTKAIEVELRKTKRDPSAIEKVIVSSAKTDDNTKMTRNRKGLLKG